MMMIRARATGGLLRLCLGRLMPVLLSAAALAQQPVKFDSATISGLPARNIGSATMSGRIAAIDAVNEDGRLTLFAASASGGVWKSVNGGTTFRTRCLTARRCSRLVQSRSIRRIPRRFG